MNSSSASERHSVGLIRNSASHSQDGGRDSRPAVCIILENNPAPFDRRVWQEALALNEAGYHVSIICPKGRGCEKKYEKINNIEIYRHSLWEAQRPIGYLFEYGWALASEFLLALKIYQRTRFRIIHACNPPDDLFLIGAFFKLLGVRFIFDHHDLCPELFHDRFGTRHLLLQRVVRLCEKLTFQTADVCIATNESYREIAITRGGVSPERVFVVRSCLDLDKVTIREPKLELKAGKRHLVVYLGVMGPQDGVHLLLQSISIIVKEYQRHDTHFALIGYGTETPRLQALAAELALGEFVTFTGRIPDRELEDYLSTADVAVAPDPANALNDKSTMNKILHYMAYGLPIVQYDLTEGRRSAENASLYAENDDPEEFAGLVIQLLDSDSLRATIGEQGRRRIESRLNWGREKQELLRAYESAWTQQTSPIPGAEALVEDVQKVSSFGNGGHASTEAHAGDLAGAGGFPSKVPRYVMITPARDEAEHIEHTIRSVAQQTVRPSQWIIVDDGSDDDTGRIIDHYARRYPWITALHRENRGFRQPGGGVMDAFYFGYEHLTFADWDFLVKLDADLSFATDYFERCFAEFSKAPRLGIGGGSIYHLKHGKLRIERTPTFHVRGATKIYKRECWDALGGLHRAPGWDTLDELKANMLGWQTQSFDSLKVSHHRTTGAAQGAWKDRVKSGRANYISGYHPLFMLFRCIRRIATKPYLLGSIALGWGYVNAWWTETPRVNDRQLIDYTRNQQLRRLLLLESIWK